MAHEFSQGTLTAGTCYLSKADVLYIWSMTARIYALEAEVEALKSQLECCPIDAVKGGE